MAETPAEHDPDFEITLILAANKVSTAAHAMAETIVTDASHDYETIKKAVQAVLNAVPNNTAAGIAACAALDRAECRLNAVRLVSRKIDSATVEMVMPAIKEAKAKYGDQQ